MGTFPAVYEAGPTEPRRAAVLAVASNKGGVGKTTAATNLAIYLRALREDLPVLVVGLDDQHTLDRMFALRPPSPGDGNLKHGWAERSLDRVIQLGEYGVHFVPSPPDATPLKQRAADSGTLRSILDHTDWDGVVIVDTKSDLESLTRNALHAADRIVVPVSDRAALEEATRIFRLLERDRIPRERARVLFTLVDRRTRMDDGQPMVDELAALARYRGWPCYRTSLSRSPRVEALISGGDRPLSILHHGAGTAVHRELREWAEEVLGDLGLAPGRGRVARRAVPPVPAAGAGLGRGLLRALRGR